MNKHIDDTRLNDYVEGLVPKDVARQVEVHLAACEACSGRLEALTLLLSELAGLPADATPARDLWSDVRSGIEAGPGQGERESQDTLTDGDVAIPNIVADEGAAIPIAHGRSGRTRRFWRSLKRCRSRRGNGRASSPPSSEQPGPRSPSPRW